MKKFPSFHIALFVFILQFSFAVGAENQPAPPKTEAGQDYSFTIGSGRQARPYLLHMPKGYTPGSPAPLVIALHGGGGDMDYMARDDLYGLISKSDEAGFVVAFPNGFSKFRAGKLAGKLATWNAGACCGDARDRQVDDVAFIRAVVADIAGKAEIDKNRIYAIGMSNGGMMAYRLACEASDIFKAIASVAGTDNTMSCTPARPVSILHIHAQNDDHVLFGGGAGEGAFKAPTKVTDFTSVSGTIKGWTDRDRCTVTAPKRVLSVRGAYCDLYSPCAAGSQVKLCVTEAGGHSWPGGRKPRAETPPSRAISANDQIWDFFNGLQ